MKEQNGWPSMALMTAALRQILALLCWTWPKRIGNRAMVVDFIEMVIAFRERLADHSLPLA
jgi:hypothetical protein